jgi:hypothetical protein
MHTCSHQKLCNAKCCCGDLDCQGGVTTAGASPGVIIGKQCTYSVCLMGTCTTKSANCLASSCCAYGCCAVQTQ